jgi:hypothetical protein
MASESDGQKDRLERVSQPWADALRPSSVLENQLSELYRRRGIVVAVGLAPDGSLVPLATQPGIRGAFSAAAQYFVRFIGVAGNVSPGWPVPVPPIPADAVFRVLVAVYNSTGIIAAPGVRLFDADNAVGLGPSTGATTATTGTFDLLPRGESIRVPFGLTFQVVSGAAGDTYDIVLVRES